MTSEQETRELRRGLEELRRRIDYLWHAVLWLGVVVFALGLAVLSVAEVRDAILQLGALVAIVGVCVAFLLGVFRIFDRAASVRRDGAKGTTPPERGEA